MNTDFQCPNCKEPVEAGARFCGNCGQPILEAESDEQAKQIGQTLISQVYSNDPEPLAIVDPVRPLTPSGTLPPYAIALPRHHYHWPTVGIIFGIVGVFSTFVVPVFGVALGLIGLFFATTTPRHIRSRLKIAALIVSSVALLFGTASEIRLIQHNATMSQKAATLNAQPNGSSEVATMSISTPCYAMSFSQVLNVQNPSKSCSFEAYNNSSINTSTDVFKIDGGYSQSLNQQTIDTLGKTAIVQDISKNLPQFTINSQLGGYFAGDPAYYVEAIDQSANQSVMEAIVYHPAKNGDNFFVLLHAANSQSVNLAQLDNQWKWK
jgi:hypothetical protein